MHDGDDGVGAFHLCWTSDGWLFKKKNLNSEGTETLQKALAIWKGGVTKVFYEVIEQQLTSIYSWCFKGPGLLSGWGVMLTDFDVVNRDDMSEDSLSDRVLCVKWKSQAVLPLHFWINMDTWVLCLAERLYSLGNLLAKGWSPTKVSSQNMTLVPSPT